MALIKCSECGKEISDTANSCPNCGYNIKKEKLNEKKKNITKNVKKQIPKLRILIIILISIIVGFFLLENIIDFIGEKISEKKYQEFFYYKFDNREYNLYLEKGYCGFSDSAYENQFKFDCSYEITKGNSYNPEEFMLHLTINNLDDDDPNKNFGTLHCKRTQLTNSEKGIYYWVNCEKDNGYNFNVYTNGTKKD